MAGLPNNLPTDPDALIALLKKQQQLHEQLQDSHEQLQRSHEQQLAYSQQRNEQLQKSVQSNALTIEKLEERLRVLLNRQFGKKSERINPDQFNLFNEAELTAEEPVDDEPGITVKAHTRRKNPHKPLPEHLPRVDVRHELEGSELTCHCGATLQRIGEDVNEQLSIIPRQYFVVRHIRGRYACECKACAKNAPCLHTRYPVPG